MKVIARIDDSSVIVEARIDELAKLCGYRDTYALANQASRRLTVGSQIQVHEMFSRLYELERRRGELTRLATQLRAQADLLESVDPVVEAATDATPATESPS